MQRSLWSVLIVGAVVGVLVMLALTACQSPAVSPSTESRHNLVVYGFSVQEEVMTKEIFPSFESYWQQQSGGRVTFSAIFTGSEEIPKAIGEGAAAEVAILSNEQQAIWLHVNGQVESDWHEQPNKGVVSRSPMVIAVRPGNPLGITDWADLRRPGVRVIHPDPAYSGGAQWALLAEYGSVVLTGGSEQEGLQQLAEIWDNVVSSPPSAREALREFVFGAGDALVTYEQDVLLARSRGAEIELVMPPATIISEHVAVLVDQNVKQWDREVVEAFLNYLWTRPAQQAFTRYFFRSAADDELNQAVPEFQTVKRPFTVDELGGWGKVYPDVINQAWVKQPAED